MVTDHLFKDDFGLITLSTIKAEARNTKVTNIIIEVLI